MLMDWMYEDPLSVDEPQDIYLDEPPIPEPEHHLDCADPDDDDDPYDRMGNNYNIDWGDDD